MKNQKSGQQTLKGTEVSKMSPSFFGIKGVLYKTVTSQKREILKSIHIL